MTVNTYLYYQYEVWDQMLYLYSHAVCATFQSLVCCAAQQEVSECRWYRAELPFTNSRVQFGNLFPHGERVRAEGQVKWPPVRHLIQPQCPKVWPAAREHTDRNRLCEREVETSLCCKGQCLHRRSDYQWLSANTSHTITHTVSVTLLKSVCWLPGDWNDRINSSLGVMLKRRIALSIARVIMRVNWQLCYQGGARLWHMCQFLSSKTTERRYLLNPYSATKTHVPQAEEQNKSPQLTEQIENYWWKWQ